MNIRKEEKVKKEERAEEKENYANKRTGKMKIED